MQLKRTQGDSGQVLIIVALLIPLILVIGAIVVDLGNFFEHRRHLQTQADAAALAGGGSWQFPCSQAVDDAIERRALQYSGVHNADTHRTETGGYTPAPLTPLNAQVGTTAGNDVHITLNSSFWSSSTPPADYTNPAGSVCSSRVLDVKATETNTAAFFGAIHPDLTAKARVEVRDVSSTPALPFVVASPAFAQCAWAVWVNDSTGAQLGLLQLHHPADLTKPPDPVTGLFPIKNLVWESIVEDRNPAPTYQSVFLPTATDPDGPNIGVRLRVGSCTDSNRQEEYETGTSRGLVFGQTYQTGSVLAQQTPKARSVLLFASSSGGCAATSFVTSACSVDVNATVDFGGGAAPALRATIDSTTLPLTPGATPGEPWVGGSFPIAAGSGANDVTIEWARGSGQWCNDGSATCSGPKLENCTNPGNPFAPGNPCQGSLGVQQRIYASNGNSGPVVEASLLDNAVAATSFPGGSNQRFLGARFVLSALEASSATTVIRASVQSSNNRTGATDCGGPNLRNDIVNGCIGYVETQRLPLCDPDFSPRDCVPGQAGNAAGQVRQGMNTRFSCTTNYWPNDTQIKLNPERVATIMITYLGALNRRQGDPQSKYPIVAFASFYITGWDGGQNCNQNDPFPESGSDADAVWGHFFQYVGPPSTGGVPSPDLCTIGSVATCVYTLVE